MLEFFRNLFAPSTSSSTAKERLRLVLMTDHISLAPEMIEQLKRDLVDVISRYVEVDRQKIDVSFEQQDHALAMLANIPIISVGRPTAEPPKSSETPSASVPTAAMQTGGDVTPLPKRKRRRRASTAQASV